MAKDKLTDYDSTASGNLDVGGVSVAEGMLPSGVNNAIRELMSHQAEAFGAGTPLYVDQTNNRVGIGTSSPANELEVVGDIRVTAPSTGTTAKIGFENASGNTPAWIGIDGNQSSSLSFHVASNIGSASNFERMRIDSSGNVGIGTTSPDTTLTVNGSSKVYSTNVNNSITHSVTATSNYAQTITLDDTGLSFDNNSASRGYRFSNNGSERMRINSFGSLLLGDTGGVTGGGLLQVKRLDNARIVSTQSNSTSSQYHHTFINNSGTLVGSIFVTTTSTAYNTSSDYRLKTAVNYDWDATTRLKQLRPARFKWISDGDDAVPVDGFLAHEVQDIVPEAITGTKDAMMDEEYTVSAATGDIYTPAIEAVLDDDGVELTPAVAEVIHSTDVERPEELAEGQQWRETTAAVMGTRSVPDYQGIDQSKLVPLLVKTIQELEARIAALENA